MLGSLELTLAKAIRFYQTKEITRVRREIVGGGQGSGSVGHYSKSNMLHEKRDEKHAELPARVHTHCDGVTRKESRRCHPSRWMHSN